MQCQTLIHLYNIPEPSQRHLPEIEEGADLPFEYTLKINTNYPTLNNRQNWLCHYWQIPADVIWYNALTFQTNFLV